MKLSFKDYRQDYLNQRYAVIINDTAKIGYNATNPGDTTFSTIVKVAIADSVMWSYYSLNDRSLMLPGVTLIRDDGGSVVFGIDSIGNLYPQYQSYGFYQGGFVGKDSINIKYGNTLFHYARTTVIKGHRLP